MLPEKSPPTLLMGPPQARQKSLVAAFWEFPQLFHKNARRWLNQLSILFRERALSFCGDVAEDHVPVQITCYTTLP